MFAYAGSYRIDGDKVIHRIDISWNQHCFGNGAIGVFKITGDTLTIITHPYKSSADGSGIRTVAVWTRMR